MSVKQCDTAFLAIDKLSYQNQTLLIFLMLCPWSHRKSENPHCICSHRQHYSIHKIIQYSEYVG